MSLLLAFIVLVASWPVGLILKKMTKEEIKQGKKYFQYIWMTTFLIAVFFLIIPMSDYTLKNSIIFSLLFIANVAFISWK